MSWLDLSPPHATRSCRRQCRNKSCIPVTPSLRDRKLSSHLPAHQFRLGHLLDGVLGPFAAGTAELYTAIWHLVHAILRHFVDHAAAAGDFAGGGEGLLDVAGVDARLQAVFGFVHPGYGFVQSLVGVHAYYRAEGFAAGEARIR